MQLLTKYKIKTGRKYTALGTDNARNRSRTTSNDCELPDHHKKHNMTTTAGKIVVRIQIQI
jgi:hypothetical protein